VTDAHETLEVIVGRSSATAATRMAMATRSPSLALEYPDSDMEQEIVATLFAEEEEEGDHQDEMVNPLSFVSSVLTLRRTRWWRWKRNCGRGRRAMSFSIGMLVRHCHRAVSLLVFVHVVHTLMCRFAEPRGRREEEERASVRRDPRG